MTSAIRIATLVFVAGSLALLWSGSHRASGAATALYPDLRTLPPSDLRFGTDPSLPGHHLLRFSNRAWNAGEGPLELRGDPTQTSKDVYQRIYANDGSYIETKLNVDFTFSASDGHNHWHFPNFAKYELWTHDDWLNRTGREPMRRGEKTTFCIMDTDRIDRSASTPRSPTYTQCGQVLQGMTRGWGDTYKYYLGEQWIDLGSSPLANGRYVLRSIADPLDVIRESADQNSARDGTAANEAITIFDVTKGQIKVVR